MRKTILTTVLCLLGVCFLSAQDSKQSDIREEMDRIQSQMDSVFMQLHSQMGEGLIMIDTFFVLPFSQMEPLELPEGKEYGLENMNELMDIMMQQMDQMRQHFDFEGMQRYFEEKFPKSESEPVKPKRPTKRI